MLSLVLSYTTGALEGERLLTSYSFDAYKTEVRALARE